MAFGTGTVHDAEEAPMRIFMFVPVLAGILGLSTYASAQATVETVLTHGLASSAGTGIGTTLGNATNQLAGRVGQQTSTATPRQGVTVVKGAPRTRAKVPSAGSAAQPASGSLIASIQGGERQEGSCPHQPAAAPAVKGAGEAHPTKPSHSDCRTQPAPAADAHPSVVNLPASQ